MNEKKKVWIVYQGCYSSREVVAICTSKEETIKIQDRVGNFEVDIEEVFLDELISKSQLSNYYEIIIPTDGVINSGRALDSYEVEDWVKDRITILWDSYHNCDIMTLKAKSFSEALKIAQDQWAMIQAYPERYQIYFNYRDKLTHWTVGESYDLTLGKFLITHGSKTPEILPEKFYEYV